MKERRCAVIGCPNPGQSHVCPYDGVRHHHGRIHYDCGYPKHSVEFHPDAWDYVCYVHYELLKREREEFVRAKKESTR